jgi:uncharacterized protein (TIGR03437 family)
VNGASFKDGIAAGSWVAIFGQNLAAGTRAMTTDDLVNGNMPSSLGGVSVNVNNKAAFLYYVSPTQINVLAPADTSTGAVSVTVTNSGGTSAAASAMLLAAAPALFASGGNVAAVRPDGTVIDGSSVSAKAGDTIELFGTGFGATSPAVTPGVVFQGSAPLVGTATVTIGGVNAVVSYAGLVGTGLYQLNVVVPALASGTYPVLASVGGVSSQGGVVLKVAG